jgi:AP-4 complex subunit mu-1
LRTTTQRTRIGITWVVTAPLLKVIARKESLLVINANEQQKLNDMIHNFFVLSPRGDTILAKQYRSSEMGAHERTHTEAFFRKIQFWDDTKSVAEDAEDISTTSLENKKRVGDAPPVFVMPDGLTYFHIRRNGLVLGASSARNVSPNTVLEVRVVLCVHHTSSPLSHLPFQQLLSTIARIFKDYCGTLSEEALRKNFILCYELLDEMIDFGYPQVTRTENLKSFVYNEPIVVDSVPLTGNMVNPKTASAAAVHKPVISSVSANGRKTTGQQNSEIFVDILERLNVLFSNNGYVLNSTIDGCIQMKSYLAGNPELRLALNEDLVIGKHSGKYGSVCVDDMNFNDCVNRNEFESARTLSFIPPDGEFVVLNYRITGEFSTPFRIFPSMDEVSPTKVEITVLIRAEMPSNHFGANVLVEMPMPQGVVAAASCSLINAPGTGHASAEYVAAEHKIVWTMKKFPGGAEQTMKVKVTLNKPCTTQIRRQMGPINMCFEIPMYNVSNLQVRYLRVAENMVGYTPYRWVRYVTQSSSYVCRL